jgi:hypothetical protein
MNMFIHLCRFVSCFAIPIGAWITCDSIAQIFLALLTKYKPMYMAGHVITMVLFYCVPLSVILFAHPKRVDDTNVARATDEKTTESKYFKSGRAKDLMIIGVLSAIGGGIYLLFFALVFVLGSLG